MDRCRCTEYEAAVKKLKIYTMGTLRPDTIDNHDSTGFAVSWFKMGISHHDMRFLKPCAKKVLEWHQLPQNRLAGEAKKIEQMWCPFMTPYVDIAPVEDKNMYSEKE